MNKRHGTNPPAPKTRPDPPANPPPASRLGMFVAENLSVDANKVSHLTIHAANRKRVAIRLAALSEEMLAALVACVEHMEHSTPEGQAAWEAARTLIDKATSSNPLPIPPEVQ